MKLFRDPFVLLTIAVCSALLLPSLFMDGMFMDGTLYVSVARNYALHHGTFWEPTFSQTDLRSFHEQPPLMFFVEGLWFRLIGDHFYTERFFCLLCALISSILIIRCWSKMTAVRTGWLPVLWWFIIPVVFYVFINNMEEMLMSLFVLASFTHVLTAVKEEGRTSSLHWFCAGIWTLFAGLTKGPQGMFLLASPFIAFIIFRKRSILKAGIDTFFISLPLLIFIALLFISPPVMSSMKQYLHDRIIHTFLGDPARVSSRFHQLGETIQNIIVPALTAMLLLFSLRKKTEWNSGWKKHRKMILFLLFIGASAILPLMLTLEQRGFYVMTGMSFLAMVIALLTEPHAAFLNEYLLPRKRARNFITAFAAVTFTAVIIMTFLLWGKPKRDGYKLSFIHEMARITGDGTVINATLAVNKDWSFLTYAQRFHSLSISLPVEATSQWYIATQSEPDVPEGFHATGLSESGFSLYHRTDSIPLQK